MFRNFLWVFIEKGAMMTIQFITLLILARLLTPAEYGIYGIMLIFISLSDILVDSGFGGAIVQKKNLTQKDVNTLFLSNLGISIVLYIIIFAFAGIIENYYEVDGLSSYLRVLSLAIVFFAFSIVHNSMMMRNLQFRKLAVITVSSSFMSSLIAIILAYYKFGVWALVLQQVLMSLFLAGSLWIFSKVKIFIEFSTKSFKHLWSFGSNLLFANLLSTFYNNLCSSIIPKIATLAQAGYFNQARRLQVLPNNIILLSIDKAAFPILSKESAIDKMLDKGRIINKMFLTICAPIFPTLSLMSYVLIKIFLGAEWLPAASYLAVLFWAAYGLLVQGLYRNMFKSVGYTKKIFEIEMCNTLVSLIILLLAIKGGIMFIVYGIVISSVLGSILWMIYAKKYIAYDIKIQIADLLPPLVLCLVSYVICMIISYNIDNATWSSLVGLLCLFFYFVIGLLVRNTELMTISHWCIKCVNKVFKR